MKRQAAANEGDSKFDAETAEKATQKASKRVRCQASKSDAENAKGDNEAMVEEAPRRCGQRKANRRPKLLPAGKQWDEAWRGIKQDRQRNFPWSPPAVLAVEWVEWGIPLDWVPSDAMEPLWES